MGREQVIAVLRAAGLSSAWRNTTPPDYRIVDSVGGNTVVQAPTRTMYLVWRALRAVDARPLVYGGNGDGMADRVIVY